MTFRQLKDHLAVLAVQNNLDIVELDKMEITTADTSNMRKIIRGGEMVEAVRIEKFSMPLFVTVNTHKNHITLCSDEKGLLTESAREHLKTIKL